MIPGSRYKFRIKAENSYGITEPGDESDPFDVGGVSSDRFDNKINYYCSRFDHILDDHNLLGRLPYFSPSYSVLSQLLLFFSILANFSAADLILY